MNEFLQTLGIAVIPAIITAIASYLAAAKNSKMQIETIREQNKADIEKLIKESKMNIEALKEKHRLDMDSKEKEYLQQIEILKLQHDNEMKKDEENLKKQMAANAMGVMLNGFMGSLFSQDSPVSNKLNEVIGQSLEDAIKNKNSHSE